MDLLSEVARTFDELVQQCREALGRVEDEAALRAAHARYAGKQGAIRLLLQEMLKHAAGPLAAAAGQAGDDMPPAVRAFHDRRNFWLGLGPVSYDRKEVGRLGNAALQQAEALFEERLAALRQAARERDLARKEDVTLPGRPRRLGSLHPLTLVRRELEEIFKELGFVVAEGPQVETDFHNFEALAMPKDHPARDMQDTFYLPGELVLRTHTSPVQVRTMLAQPPPIRIIAPGRVYRKDEDATHSPMFNQIEGLVVDEGISMADLKGTLLHFIHRFFGPGLGMRLRPSFFPFTEPSAELDMECLFCRGAGCRTCKGSGYIEIMGCGMVDPEVFRQVRIDSERYTGFAFGGGIDRMAMLRYGVNDLRLFFSGDVRFTRQFG